MYIRRRQPGFHQRSRQRGVVLLLALIFLVLLTLLAIGASSGSLLQQRMVAATRSAQLATLSADTALRGAEWTIWSSAMVVGTPFNCGTGALDATTGCVIFDPATAPYSATGAVTLFRTPGNAWLPTGIAYTGPTGDGFTAAADEAGIASPNVADNPRYIIERLGLVGPGGPHESGVTGPNNCTPQQGCLYIFRITARATGGSRNTVRVVQSTFDAQVK